MAKEARSTPGAIYEHKEMREVGEEAKQREEGWNGVNAKAERTKERGEKHKRKARGNETFDEDSRN